MIDLKKASEDLDEVENYIEKRWSMIHPDASGANPRDLVTSSDFAWYRDALKELEPYYQRARYLHEVVANCTLASMKESSDRLDHSSRRLNGITWGLLALTTVLTGLTVVLVLTTIRLA